MYTLAYDGTALMLVHLFTGRSSTDAENAQMIEGWRRLYRDAGSRAAFAAVVVEAGHPPPNAYVRKRIVEVGRTAQGPVLTAIVTESTLIRGVITATNWLRDRTDLHDTYAFATLELGAAQFERTTGRSMDRLRSLYSDALRRAQPLAARAGAA
jgi:hypothetical protein